MINDNHAKNQRLTIIAGPCSAETEAQVMSIARSLSASGHAGLFRAGIWKPRTRPGSFEGIGAEGLKWLQQVHKAYGLPCATEVATPSHVYEAMKYGIDTVWIGARTTANPFAMQELAAALRGAAVKVMIKNPVNPDADLWTGAVERVQCAGVEQPALIHRGFSAYGPKIYRNEPYWDIALELRKRFPDLPLICDPSHMGGSRKYLYELSRHAITLGYDGLMIEAHPDPAAAWSDAKQQVTAEELSALLLQLDIPAPARHSIPGLRGEIDRIDDQLLEMIGQRMTIAEKIGNIKRSKNQPVVQATRWQQLIGRLTHKGQEKGLSSILVANVFTAIHEESVRHQQEIVAANREAGEQTIKNMPPA